MREEKLSLGILLLVLFAGMISATATTIVVKTVPVHEVKVTPFNSEKVGFESYAYLKNTSDSYGDATVLFDSSVAKFGIFITINKDGEKIYSEKLEDTFIAGEQINIRVAPDWFEFIETPSPEPVANETEANKTETLNETESIANKTEESSSLLTGNVFSEITNIFKNKILYYVLGGMILAIIGFFGFQQYLKMKDKLPREIKIKKLSELKQEQVQQGQEDEELRIAEEELRKAQEKIATLKNKDKISELQKEIDQKQEELRKLRGNN